MSAVDSERWQRIAALFDAVVEAAPEDRDSVLAAAAGQDAALRDAVLALLRADAHAAAFDHGVEAARASAIAAWHDDDSGAAAGGRRIGPWRIVREIGRGGMGLVYLAERADGAYEQQAAIKLIKRGMDSEAILARFLRERQILARLDHPHIARLLDGGLADDARPYFAMEYIDGVALPAFCRAQALNVAERIALFLDVCAAVQFAHGRLVVHRDIKPSNILVTPARVAKLLDFGIAKLVEHDAGDATATALGHDRPLTPAYAAPEQLRGEPATIASDIYALGCVLHVLLSGTVPYGVEATDTIDVVRRRRDTVLRLPSEMARDAEGAVPAARLRGDLDTLIMKALHPQPERRYATVDALAADLRRFLAGLPIDARRDRVAYRMRKFVARHRVGVAAGVLAAAALLASTAIAWHQADSARREAQASAQTMQFLVDVFQGADPTQARGAALTAQDLLDQGSARLRDATGVAPEVRARLLATIAATYTALGLYERALGPAREAVDLARTAAPDSLALAHDLVVLGRVLRLSADLDAADAPLREAQALQQHRAAADDAQAADTAGEIGALARARGHFADAQAPLQSALALSEKHFGADAPDTARRLDDLAANLDDLGKSSDAEAAYRRALAMRQRRLGADDPEVATSELNLGVHLDQSGEYDEATRLIEHALAVRRRVYGPDHPLVAYAELGLAGVFASTNDARAEAHAQAALTVLQRALPADHPRVAEAFNTLAIVHLARRDFPGGVALAREVVARFERRLGPRHPDTLTAKNNLAWGLQHAGMLAEAERLQREVLAALPADDGQGVNATDMQNLAVTLMHEDKAPEAVTWSQRALDLVREREGAASGNAAVALRSLGFAEEAAGDLPGAERDFRAAVALGEDLAKTKGMSRFGWSVPLADLLVHERRCAEAAPLLDAAHAELANASPRPPESLPSVEALQAACSRGDGARAQLAAAKAALAALPGVAFDLSPTVAQLVDAR